MGAGMTRVDRGDGKLFNVAPAELKDFIAANPGAKAVAPRGEIAAVTPQEEAASAALETPAETPATPTTVINTAQFRSRGK